MDQAVSSTNSGSSSALKIGGVIALVLLIVGGLNWALVGLFSFDLVATLFGTMTTPTRAVYIVVGLAALFALTLFPRLTGPAATHRA